MCDLNKKEFFLVEEYKSSIELTFHIDSLRNKLTSFFISIAGIGIAGLLLLLKKEGDDSNISNLNEIVATLLFLVALIGHLFVLVLAKIRKVQLEYFGIINNIKKYFYTNDYDFWNISQLSIKTLPKPRAFSGTYYWLLIIQVLNVTILFLGIILIQDLLNEIFSFKGLLILSATTFISLVIQNVAYFCSAKPPAQKIYTDENLPF